MLDRVLHQIAQGAVDQDARCVKRGKIIGPNPQLHLAGTSLILGLLGNLGDFLGAPPARQG